MGRFDHIVDNRLSQAKAVKRMLVHESLADQFVEQLVEKTKKWRYGDPMDTSMDMGTVVDEQAARLFEQRVNKAVDQGAKLIIGNLREGAL